MIPIAVLVAPQRVPQGAGAVPGSLRTTGALAFKLRGTHALRWSVWHFSAPADLGNLA